jgi:hypothetical protein
VALAVLGTVPFTPQRAVADFYSDVILADNPVGYWRLGESPGQTTAVDASPFGRNGTYVGNVTRGVPGAIVSSTDTAARFDGATGYVAIPGGPFNFANNFTLEAWVINNNTGPFVGRIFSNRQAGGYGFGVLPDGRMRFTTFGILDYDSAVVVPNDGRYHYVAVTFNSSNAASFYLDGTLRQMIGGPAPAASSSAELDIGRNPFAPSMELWNGTIDEAAIYGRVLSDAQVLAHYQAGITPVVPEPSTFALLGLGALGLIGYRRGRTLLSLTPTRTSGWSGRNRWCPGLGCRRTG